MRTLEVETLTQLVVHQLAGVRTEGALVRRAKDIRLPLESVVAVLDRTQHRLSLNGGEREGRRQGRVAIRGACKQFAGGPGPSWK